MRPYILAFLIGNALGALTLAALHTWKPWDPAHTPTQAQHQAAIAAGSIEGTDGYYRFIFGPDAY